MWNIPEPAFLTLLYHGERSAIIISGCEMVLLYRKDTTFHSIVCISAKAIKPTPVVNIGNILLGAISVEFTRPSTL